MDMVKELIEHIEHNYKSKIKSASIYCEVETDQAITYITFYLKNGESKEVCLDLLEGENLSYDDANVILRYNDLVKKCANILTNEYNVECRPIGIYDYKTLYEKYYKFN